MVGEAASLRCERGHANSSSTLKAKEASVGFGQLA